jgi:hypothetical protein
MAAYGQQFPKRVRAYLNPQPGRNCISETAIEDPAYASCGLMGGMRFIGLGLY